MSYLGNNTFRAGLAPWRAFNKAGSVATDIGNDDTAFSGTNFLRFQTSASGGSVAVDFVAQQPIAGVSQGPQGGGELAGFTFPSSLFAQLWIRARPGFGPVSGTLAFWELGLARNEVNNPNTLFAVAFAWTPIALSIDLRGAGPTVRLEVYLDTLNAALDIGAVVIS